MSSIQQTEVRQSVVKIEVGSVYSEPFVSGVSVVLGDMGDLFL